MANGLVAGMLAPALWVSTRSMAFGMGAMMLLGSASTGLLYWLSRRKPQF